MKSVKQALGLGLRPYPVSMAALFKKPPAILPLNEDDRDEALARGHFAFLNTEAHLKACRQVTGASVVRM